MVQRNTLKRMVSSIKENNIDNQKLMIKGKARLKVSEGDHVTAEYVEHSYCWI